MIVIQENVPVSMSTTVKVYIMLRNTSKKQQIKCQESFLKEYTIKCKCSATGAV